MCMYYLQAHIYQDKGQKCSAFLANIDEHNSATVRFQNQDYTLPPWSVSILPDCINSAFNTAKVLCYSWLNDGFYIFSIMHI